LKLLLSAAALAALLCAPRAAHASDRFSGIYSKKAEGETPNFLPTLSAALGYDSAEEKKSRTYGNFWLGLSHYPLSQPWSPFYSVGMELDLRTIVPTPGSDATKTVAVFGPQVRAGISFFPENNGYISVLNAYAFGGYRAPSGFDDGVVRVGLGVSSPGVGLALLTSGIPLPWMAEFAIDTSGDATRVGGRVGVSY